MVRETKLEGMVRAADWYGNYELGERCYDPGETTDDDEDSGGRALRDEG